MQSRRGAVLAAALVLTAMMASDALAQRRDRDRDRDRDSDWVDLGCQTVSFRADRDVLRVGRRDGRFGAIRLHARGGDVEMLDLKVVYSNGQPDDIQVRRILRRGERTNALDLRGGERSIDRVEMVYRAAANFRGREAVVCVEGLAHAAPPPPRHRAQAPGLNSAASKSPCSAGIATPFRSDAARVASSRFACTCAARTSRCWI